MFSFKEWHNDIYEDDDFIIEEVPMSLTEAIILGHDVDSPEDNLRKYKVTFKSFKHQKAYDAGFHDNETIYALGTSSQDVRKRVMDYIYDERHAKFAKGSDSYKVVPDWVKTIKRGELGVRIKEIKTWQDLVSMLDYLSQHKPKYTNDFFTHHDLNILLSKYDKSKDFWGDIQALPKDIQLLLRKFLRTAIQDPALPISVKQKLDAPGKYSDRSKSELIQGGTRNMGKVWAKGRDSKAPDLAHGLHKYSTISEITREAKKYGITTDDLRQKAMQIVSQKTYENEENGKLWDFINQHLRSVYGHSRNWHKAIVSLDWTDPAVVDRLKLAELLTQVKEKFPQQLPGAKRELRSSLGMNIKMTTETRTPITTISTVTLYKWLGGSDVAKFAAAAHTPDIFADRPTADLNVKDELNKLLYAKFQDNPDAFADFLNFILSDYKDTIPAVRLYHRGRSIVGLSPGLAKDFDADDNGIHLRAKPNAKVTLNPTKSYISIKYKVEGGTIYGTTLYIYNISDEQVEIKMTNLTAMK